MQRKLPAKEVEDEEEYYDEYDGGEEGGYYGSHGDAHGDAGTREEAPHIEDGDEGGPLSPEMRRVAQTSAKPPASARRALTESEEEDLQAEEELAEDEDGSEGSMTYDEYLASKKSSSVLAQLKSTMKPMRQANEGRQQVASRRGFTDDDEVPYRFYSARVYR